MRRRNFWGTYEKGVSILLVFVLTLLATSLGPAVRDVGAAPVVTVRFVIERVQALNDIDTTSEADFYPKVTLDGQFENKGSIEDDDDIEPNWVFSRPVDLAVRSSITGHIEIWDADDTFNGADNEIDINGAGNLGGLDVTIALNPCSVTANSDGGSGLCGTQLSVAGGDGDRARMWFRVEVDYPVVPDLRMRCTHGPVWPQGGQTVNFAVQALDGALNAQPVNKIELFINTQGTPTQTVNGASQLNANGGPFTAGTTIYYGCRVTSGNNAVWSGWRRVQIGAPPASQGRAVPISFTGSSQGRIDIVFIPDSNSYTGPNDANFLNDVASVIQGSFYARDVYLRNQDVINFWIAQDTGTTTLVSDGSGGNDCSNAAPSNWISAYPFADSGVILHTPACRDNANRNQRYFSVEPTSLDVVVHEMGHQPFGLADEYCQGDPTKACDGGYFQNTPFPNVYMTLAACQADPLAAGVADACRQIANASSNVNWWRLDSAATFADDLMNNNGAYRAADIRRHDWLFGQCHTAKC